MGNLRQRSIKVALRLAPLEVVAGACMIETDELSIQHGQGIVACGRRRLHTAPYSGRARGPRCGQRLVHIPPSSSSNIGIYFAHVRRQCLVSHGCTRRGSQASASMALQ